MLLMNVRLAAEVLATAFLLAMADGMFAQQATPVGQADTGSVGIKDEKEHKDQLDAATPANQTDTEAIPQAEVLCERIQFCENVIQPGNPEIASNCEKISEQNKITTCCYGLSSVTVPEAGWKIHSRAIYTESHEPEDWLKLRRAGC